MFYRFCFIVNHFDFINRVEGLCQSCNTIDIIFNIIEIFSMISIDYHFDCGYNVCNVRRPRSPRVYMGGATMGILKVFKWIFFSVFIISLALFGVGHYFAISDMTTWIPLKGGDDGVYLSSVLSQLENRNLLGNIKAAAEKTPDAQEATEGEIATGGEAQEPAPVEETGYTLDGHSKIEIIAMKLGVSTSPMTWITEPLHIGNTQITLSLFVGYSALLLSFILHIITKRHKTVYGSILMIVGFLFIIGFYAASYYPIDLLLGLKNSFVAESNDYQYLTVIAVVAFSLLGALIGIPIYSCGVRQITCRRLKKRLRRRSASA